MVWSAILEQPVMLNKPDNWRTEILVEDYRRGTRGMKIYRHGCIEDYRMGHKLRLQGASKIAVELWI